MNTIGQIFRLTTFGESHGVAVGGVIDGCPSGLRIDRKRIADALARRATGSTASASQRREADAVEFLSGLLDGVTLGTPIAFMVRNEDARPEDYEAFRNTYRPSHADYTYEAKYGLRDWRGGGRASARATVPVVVAGAIAQQWLASRGITVEAVLKHVGGETDPQRIDALLSQCRAEGDSVGGVALGTIQGLPAGLGEPMFDKFQACLAKAMFSIPAVKGFQYGDGFAMASMRGSEANDPMEVAEDGSVTFLSNHSGGIQGGITNGEEVRFEVAFKPIPTIGRDDRHDVCALPRALVVVESMAALTVADQLLLGNRTISF
ncbi:MAG: chorismate synthase [Bacteroidales bacterium]|nr:chorismate synthase [Bacteroidales bacterium]